MQRTGCEQQKKGKKRLSRLNHVMNREKHERHEKVVLIISHGGTEFTEVHGELDEGWDSKDY